MCFATFSFYNVCGIMLMGIFKILKVSVLMKSDLAVFPYDRFYVLQSSSFKLSCFGSFNSNTWFCHLKIWLHSHCWNQTAHTFSFCLTCFYQDSVEYCIIGVTILSQLTNEINQVSATAFLIEVSAIFFLSLVFSALCGMIFFGSCVLLR